MPTQDTRENPLGQSIILFVIFFALFLGGIFAFSFLTLSNVWPAAIALALIFLSFVIPMTWLSRANSSDE
ncbi:hypothetical protein IV498_17215 [Paenarthrobacter sp. Z7-10]|uniref:hypothetical protein n=1 Tax=Paenarthrobacter sp. Z7-10 TaxID=2787635 RepID=UPI0022A93902|nr:hypothetical protein [Paenarthrobacter sp. Z7-10]MCZ2404863.1 hypothetical protein [Paenarthrobacter sp. Z7-10]